MSATPASIPFVPDNAAPHGVAMHGQGSTGVSRLIWAWMVCVLVSLAAAQVALGQLDTATAAPAPGAERTLRVASELDFPPLAMVKPDGTYNQIYDKWFNPIEPRGISVREIALYAAPVLGLLLVLTIVLAYRLRLIAVTLRNERSGLEAKVASRTEELAVALAAATAADRIKSAFMASVTHEFRTPLNSIIGFAELLKAEVPGPLNTKQAQFTADILASGQQLRALVEGILEMSRLDAAGAALKREPVEIGAVLAERVAAHRKPAEARGVTMRLDVAADAGRAELDPLALCRMFDTLLDNAIKFNREGGMVTVRARWDDGWLEIAVADTGIGIAREDLPKLFKPFAQLSAGFARRYGGVGLGLALARGLAEEHGGTLEVASELGHGSTFTLRLPIQEDS